jgi:two-component system response regulator HydG
MDCGAPENCWKRTFGHEKGSFTGALNQKIITLNFANGGTLFLDEIANLSYSTGTELCKNKKVKRLGGNKEIAHARIIIASNETYRKQSEKVSSTCITASSISITVPPLRERGRRHYVVPNSSSTKQIQNWTKHHRILKRSC